MVKIILVRHGETEWNKAHRIQGGTSDVPLNEVGINQARKLAERLKDEKIEAIYSSPLHRALDTAREVARYHGLEVNSLLALREIDAGSLEGFPAANLKLRFDEYICQGNYVQADIPYPLGEYICDVQKRSWVAIQDIARQHQGTVVIVTHYFVIMTLVCQILGLPLAQIVHLRLGQGTVTAFTLDGDGDARLELFNDSCHMQGGYSKILLEPG
jgi:broad specificity phosphatase PhoE